MSKLHALLMTVVLTSLMCLVVGLALTQRVAAQDEENEPAFANVLVVAYASGLTGFFDQGTGKLYLYDSNLKNCVAIRQLTTLGEPTAVIR